MKCKRSQRWSSDEIDGALPEKRKRKLESHLAVCSTCRAYHQDLLRLQARSRSVQAGPLSPDYFENFAAAVATKLRTARPTPGRKGPFPMSLKWAWLAVPLAIAVVLGIVLFHKGGKVARDDIFSFEACLDRVFQEIGDDDAAAADFNRLLSGSVLGGGEDVFFEDDVELWNEPFFWRSLTDEDLQLIEEEIRKSFRS
jgi:hypothetical protein